MLLCSVARGQAPSYSSAGIVNAANYAAGPFAPNSVIALFGTNLSNNANGVAASESVGGTLPMQGGLAGVNVYVQNIAAPLLYVSPGQINFLIPAELVPGTYPVRVVKQGLTGAEANVTLVPGAPALFPNGNGYALAVDWTNANAVITPATPARSGDLVILYATGLGTAGSTPSGQIPAVATLLNNLGILKVYLDGTAVDSSAILYAGVTPGWAGLYQINLVLPNHLPVDPEIIVAIGNQSSPAGLKLALK